MTTRLVLTVEDCRADDPHRALRLAFLRERLAACGFRLVEVQGEAEYREQEQKRQERQEEALTRLHAKAQQHTPKRGWPSKPARR